MTAVRGTVVVLVLLVASSVAGCSKAETDGGVEGTSTFEVQIQDSLYDMEALVPAGRVTLLVDNQDSLDHQAMILRFHDGEDVNSYIAASDADPSGVGEMALVDYVGGTNTTEPGTETATVQDLTPGHYALICYVDQHYKAGMFEPFEVTAQQAPAEPLVGDATIGLTDFGFDVPSELETGEGTFLVSNDGAQVHELSIMRLTEEHTVDEVTEALGGGGPLPDFVLEFGGVGGLDPGLVATTEVELPPGLYVLACAFPDPETGSAHYQLGMAVGLEVTDSS
jgi:uncharacterized cupredoxin-like copper-binding protein